MSMTKPDAISEWLFKYGHLKDRHSLLSLLDAYKSRHSEMAEIMKLEQDNPTHSTFQEHWYVEDKARYELEIALAEAALELWRERVLTHSERGVIG